jgi:hypothetical protein
LWNDGRLAAVISNMNAPPSLLVNEVRTPNHWITLRLTGSFPAAKTKSQATSTAPGAVITKSSRDAIGARIRVKAGFRILIDEVRSGSSFISNNDMRVHFGLGSVTKIDWVEVRWPSGLVGRFDGVSVDTFQNLKEGAGSSASGGKKN